MNIGIIQNDGCHTLLLELCRKVSFGIYFILFFFGLVILCESGLYCINNVKLSKNFSIWIVFNSFQCAFQRKQNSGCARFHLFLSPSKRHFLNRFEFPLQNVNGRCNLMKIWWSMYRWHRPQQVLLLIDNKVTIKYGWKKLDICAS